MLELKRVDRPLRAVLEWTLLLDVRWAAQMRNRAEHYTMTAGDVASKPRWKTACRMVSGVTCIAVAAL